MDLPGLFPLPPSPRVEMLDENDEPVKAEARAWPPPQKFPDPLEDWQQALLKAGALNLAPNTTDLDPHGTAQVKVTETMPAGENPDKLYSKIKYMFVAVQLWIEYLREVKSRKMTSAFYSTFVRPQAPTFADPEHMGFWTRFQDITTDRFRRVSIRSYTTFHQQLVDQQPVTRNKDVQEALKQFLENMWEAFIQPFIETSKSLEESTFLSLSNTVDPMCFAFDNPPNANNLDLTMYLFPTSLLGPGGGVSLDTSKPDADATVSAGPHLAFAFKTAQEKFVQQQSLPENIRIISSPLTVLLVCQKLGVSTTAMKEMMTDEKTIQCKKIETSGITIGTDKPTITYVGDGNITITATAKSDSLVAANRELAKAFTVSTPGTPGTVLRAGTQGSETITLKDVLETYIDTTSGSIQPSKALQLLGVDVPYLEADHIFGPTTKNIWKDDINTTSDDVTNIEGTPIKHVLQLAQNWPRIVSVSSTRIPTGTPMVYPQIRIRGQRQNLKPRAMTFPQQLPEQSTYTLHKYNVKFVCDNSDERTVDLSYPIRDIVHRHILEFIRFYFKNDPVELPDDELPDANQLLGKPHYRKRRDTIGGTFVETRGVRAGDGIMHKEYDLVLRQDATHIEMSEDGLNFNVIPDLLNDICKGGAGSCGQYFIMALETDIENLQTKLTNLGKCTAGTKDIIPHLEQFMNTFVPANKVVETQNKFEVFKDVTAYAGLDGSIKPFFDNTYPYKYKPDKFSSSNLSQAATNWRTVTNATNGPHTDSQKMQSSGAYEYQFMHAKEVHEHIKRASGNTALGNPTYQPYLAELPNLLASMVAVAVDWDSNWKDLFKKTDEFVAKIADALDGGNKTTILQELKATENFKKVIEGNDKCQEFARFITGLNIQITPCDKIPEVRGAATTSQGMAAGGIPRSLRAGGSPLNWFDERPVTTVFSLSYNEEALKGIMAMIGKINTYVERLSFLQSGASQLLSQDVRQKFLLDPVTHKWRWHGFNEHYDDFVLKTSPPPPETEWLVDPRSSYQNFHMHPHLIRMIQFISRYNNPKVKKSIINTINDLSVPIDTTSSEFRDIGVGDIVQLLGQQPPEENGIYAVHKDGQDLKLIRNNKSEHPTLDDPKILSGLLPDDINNLLDRIYTRIGTGNNNDQDPWHDTAAALNISAAIRGNPNPIPFGSAINDLVKDRANKKGVMYKHLQVMSQWIQKLTTLPELRDGSIYVAHFADKALKVSTITGVKDEDFIDGWDENTNQYKPGAASKYITHPYQLLLRVQDAIKVESGGGGGGTIACMHDALFSMRLISEIRAFTATLITQQNDGKEYIEVKGNVGHKGEPITLVTLPASEDGKETLRQLKAFVMGIPAQSTPAPAQSTPAQEWWKEANQNVQDAVNVKDAVDELFNKINDTFDVSAAVQRITNWTQFKEQPTSTDKNRRGILTVAEQPLVAAAMVLQENASIAT